MSQNIRAPQRPRSFHNLPDPTEGHNQLLPEPRECGQDGKLVPEQSWNRQPWLELCFSSASQTLRKPNGRPPAPPRPPVHGNMGGAEGTGKRATSWPGGFSVCSHRKSPRPTLVQFSLLAEHTTGGRDSLPRLVPSVWGVHAGRVLPTPGSVLSLQIPNHIRFTRPNVPEVPVTGGDHAECDQVCKC